MKILHCNDHYEPKGGAEILLFNTLRGLEERGIENVVVHDWPSKQKDAGRKAVHIPKFSDYYSPPRPAAFEEFARVLRQEKPDLVHLHDVSNPELVTLASEFAPVVQSVLNHSFYCPGGGKYLPFKEKICERTVGPGCLTSAFTTHCNSIRPNVLWTSYKRSRGMMRHASLDRIVLSEYQKEQLILNGCSPKSIRVLPPFTEIPEEAIVEPSRDRMDLLFTGRIMPTKGLPLLIQSLKHLTSPYCLHVDGDGTALAQAKKTAQDLNLSDSVRFLGWLPKEEHLNTYRNASVVMVPSVWPEPFGLVGIEAMSFGKPVIAFNVGGIPDWLKDGETGFLVKPYDLKEMAARVDTLFHNPELARKMGEAGRERVRTLYSKDRYITRLLSIYQEVLQKKYASR